MGKAECRLQRCLGLGWMNEDEAAEREVEKKANNWWLSLFSSADHHQRVRTTNLLERLFGENRRRVKVIPHFFKEKAGLKLVYATMLTASKKWRGVKMNPFIEKEINTLWETVFGQSRQATWAA